jgi:hypothetical protein
MYQTFLYTFYVKDASFDGIQINLFSKKKVKPRFTYRLSHGQRKSETTSEINV